MPFIKEPIVLDREEYCPRCKTFRMFTWVVYTDAEFHTCHDCSYKKIFRAEESKQISIPQLDSTALTGLIGRLNGELGNLSNHKWSKNLGMKDRMFVSEHIDELIKICARLREYQEGKR